MISNNNRGDILPVANMTLPLLRTTSSSLYYANISLGTPAQSLHAVVDTAVGSLIVRVQTRPSKKQSPVLLGLMLALLVVLTSMFI